MTKYNEVMEKIEVSEEMRRRILKNLSSARPKANYGMYAAAACFIVVLLCAVSVLKYTSKTPDIYDTGEVTGCGPMEYLTLEELNKNIDFEMNDIPSLSAASSQTSYIVYDDNLAEIAYLTDEGYVYYRKSIGTEDNSGDYNDYAITESVEMNGMSVTLKGNELYNCAVWNDGKFSYSLNFEAPQEKDNILKIISEIK